MPHESKNFSRRNFLSTAATGLAAAGLAGMAPSNALAQNGQPAEKKKEIMYRDLGKTGVKLPIVSMGVMNAGVPGIVQASYENGVRHFDTAAYYQMGRNEQMVGSVINKLKVRDKVVIGTKVFTRNQRRNLSGKKKVDKIISLTEASLSRLKMDYVDILYIHSISDPELVADQEFKEALTKLKEQDKIKFSALSTHTRMAEVIDAMADDGFYDVVLTTYNFTLANDTAMNNAIEKAAKAGIGIIGMKTFAGGSRWPNPESRSNYSTAVINSAAHKWVLNNKHITTTIPGYDNYEHMNEDLVPMTNLEYTDEERSFLSDNNVKLSMGFCNQCQQCLASCPNDADIPRMMRTHMYAAQYGNLAHARATYDDIDSGRKLDACVSCAECSANCSNTVDIGSRIEELKLLYA